MRAPFLIRSVGVEAEAVLDEDATFSDVFGGHNKGIIPSDRTLEIGRKEKTTIYVTEWTGGNVTYAGCVLAYSQDSTLEKSERRKKRVACKQNYSDYTYNFEYDVALVDAAGTPVQMLCSGCSTPGYDGKLFSGFWCRAGAGASGRGERLDARRGIRGAGRRPSRLSQRAG